MAYSEPQGFFVPTSPMWWISAALYLYISSLYYMHHSHNCPSVQLYICETSSLGIILTQIAKDTRMKILYVHTYFYKHIEEGGYMFNILENYFAKDLFHYSTPLADHRVLVLQSAPNLGIMHLSRISLCMIGHRLCSLYSLKSVRLCNSYRCLS